MKYDKVTILGIVGCVLFFFVWLQVSSRLAPPPRTLPAQPQSVSETPDQGDETLAQTAAAEPVSEPAAVTAVPPQPAPLGQVETATAPGQRPRPEPADKGIDLVQDGAYNARIDRDGGGIRHVELADYFQDERGGNGASRERVRLGHFDYPLLALRLPTAGWRLAPPEVRESTPQRLVLARSINDGILSLVETWQVLDAPYEVGYTIELINGGEVPVTLPGLVVEGGALPPSVSADREVRAQGGVGAGGATLALGGRPKTFSTKAIRKLDQEENARLARTPVSWVAVHSKYFLFCILPDSSDAFAGCALSLASPVVGSTAETDAKGQPERYQADVMLAPVTLGPGETHSVALRAYAGPKKYELLHSMGKGVDTVMEMDRFLFFNPRWMGLLSRGILAALIWLNGIFGGSWGYGLAIIVLTVFVKLVFWPLSHRSTVSMRRMQKLQPQLKALREKYKEDPQKMYRKQQELFKENNVSQFGSCLPIVFQIPVFFALFNTFRNAIELRQAGFLWATDLSLPDTLAFMPFGLPIRPLALLMGLTMVAQQKLMPSGDPNQARMMTFMSLFFIVLFYSMPSALTLYMTVNQVLTVAQTLATKRFENEGD